ncbi:MAG TPA: hypothetical protein VN922_24820 [Bacteroidia bacterium]|nr:hypothetical protein [Bacteroidia bacterium]
MEIQTPKWHSVVYPYELHLTVNYGSSEHFKELCEVLGVKPLLIEMQLKNGGTAEDLMCSFKQETTYEHIINKTKSLAKSFRHLGYKVIRTKIETAPWHPVSPQKEFDDSHKDMYFEAHIGVILPKGISSLSWEHKILDKWGKLLNVHKSTNVFKEETDHVIQMFTIRDHKSRVSFDRTLAAYQAVLSVAGFKTERVISEFAIYDSNISHDAEWIGE